MRSLAVSRASTGFGVLPPWSVAALVAFAGIAVAATPFRVRADVLAGWDFSTLVSPAVGANNWGPSPFAASTTASNLTVVGLTRGPAVSAYTTGTYTAASRAWGGNNWWNSGTAPDSLQSAIDRGAYITFGFTAADGYSLSFSDVSAYNVRRSSSGATLGQWQYQIGSGTFADIGSQITWGSTTTSAGNVQPSISLSGIGGLQSVPAGTSVTFRIVNYNSGTAGSVAGTWYLNDPTGASTNDFIINGSVTGTGGGNNLFWNGSSGWASTSAAAGGNGTWTDGSGGWDSAKTANFGGAAGTVTVGTASAAAGLSVTTSGYVFSGGELALTGPSIDANAVSVATGGIATIASKITGAAGLTKGGGGTLILGGANTFSGGVRIQSGTLSVAADGPLGDASNTIELNGGTLTVAGSIDLGSRSITGASGAAGVGGISVPAGSTLTSAGSVNLSSLTLPGSGTLAFNGSSTSLGGISAAAGSGTAAIVGPINFGGVNRTIDVATGGTLVLDGALTNNATLSKQGGGTLVLTQDNGTNLSRVQVGVAAATNGGTVRIATGGALGVNQTYFNYGTIEASAPLTIGAGGFGGLSLGGRTSTPARLAGAAVEVTGSIGVFGSGSPGPIRLNVDNASTFSAVMVAGTTSNVTGLTIGGTGSLRLTGDGAGLTLPVTLTDSLRASVVNDGSVAGGGVIGTSLLTVGSTAVLSGNGTVGGLKVDAGGTLEPGLSPGVFTTTGSAVLASGGNYNWQLLDATGTAGGGWDLLSVGGVLDIAATSADPFRINLWTLSGTGPDVSGNAANFNSSQTYSWTIASAAGGITGFSADKFRVVTSATNGTGGFSNGLGGGSFSVTQSANDLQLVFSLAPPSITINVASGTQTQTQAGYSTLSGSTPVVKTGGGTLVLDQANTLTGTTTVQQGTLELANGSALSTSPLAVAASATASVANYLVAGVGGLDLAATGLVDLTRGGMTIANASAAAIVPRIVEGRGDGSWTGTAGITSSAAAAAVAASELRAVGWVDNGDGSLTLAFAAPGDTNLDWVVDVLDAGNFAASGKYGTGDPATWAEGDFNYDGVVDVLDAAEFAGTGLYGGANYNSAPGIAAVPEPAVPASLLLVAAAVMAVRRRR